MTLTKHLILLMKLKHYLVIVSLSSLSQDEGYWNTWRSVEGFYVITIPRPTSDRPASETDTTLRSLPVYNSIFNAYTFVSFLNLHSMFYRCIITELVSQQNSCPRGRNILTLQTKKLSHSFQDNSIHTFTISRYIMNSSANFTGATFLWQDIHSTFIKWRLTTIYLGQMDKILCPLFDTAETFEDLQVARYKFVRISLVA